MSLRPEDILGLEKNYTRNDLRRAYINLSKDYHPDKNNFSFISKEEKEQMFLTITLAYKELLEQYPRDEIDISTYTTFKYENDFPIKTDEPIKDLESFNKKFEKIHSEENYDHPWSTYYKLKKNKPNNNLTLFNPATLKNNNTFFEYGVNECSDFTTYGKYIDLNSL